MGAIIPAPIQMQAITDFAGWSVISNKPVHSANQLPGTVQNSSRLEVISPFDADAVMVINDNMYSTTVSSVTYGETPNTNPVIYKSAWQSFNVALNNLGAATNDSNGATDIDFDYNGAPEAVCKGASFVYSSALYVPIKAGLRNFIKTTVRAAIATAPAAPVAVATAGAGVAAGTYAVSYTICYPSGIETPGSTGASVTTAAGNLQITVTDPGAINWPGALGYRVWLSAAGQTTPLYATPLGVIQFGNNAVISGVPNTSGVQGSAPRVLNGQAGTFCVGSGTLGGLNPGASNNGEYRGTGDYTLMGAGVISPNPGVVNGPLMVLARNKLKVYPSAAFIGDSIDNGYLEYGFGGGGYKGFLVRICIGQTTQRYYDATFAGVNALNMIGHADFTQPSETSATFAGAGGSRRTKMAMLCTTAICNYGTNDLSNNTSATALINTNLIIAGNFIQNQRHIKLLTLLPRTKSSDGFVTVANQSGPLTGVPNFEGARRQYNNWLRSNLGQQAIVTEAMIGAYAAYTPATNLYAGGDGAATGFQTGLPFVQGTETIFVNGVAKVLTTDYTYFGAITINGVNYAGGVTFVAAPGAGLSVTATYTSMAGWIPMMGPYAEMWDIAAPVEVNSASVLTLNGGWWIPATAPALLTSTSTGANTTTTFKDTTLNLTQDQYRNYCLMILTDSTTPAAAGQVQNIINNTSGAGTSVFSVNGWTTTPSATATYKVFDPYVAADGTHPMAAGHMLIAQYIAANGSPIL